MNEQLTKLGVTRVISDSCNCNSPFKVYTYTLPRGVDVGIVDCIKPIGTSSTSFERQAILKIENKDFSITAIKRLKQIKLLIKNSANVSVIEQLEDVLVQWLEKSTDD